MNIEKIKQELNTKKYEFLKNNEHLGKNIILLGLGGSYAYGTNVTGSDTDVRGCALCDKRELLTNITFEQFENKETDTVIYSFNKLVSLLSNCNPNTVELLGLKPEHYLYIAPLGQELLDNSKLFLSKKAIYSFGGYANQQLRRLDNKAARVLKQSENEKHILRSIENASTSFKERYFTYPEESIRLYVDKSEKEDLDSEIYMDVHLNRYPLRDYKSMWSEMQMIVKEYAKLGHRNKAAVEHGKLAKHMMHLVRLYYMCFDILEKERIITYREEEHDLLMDIRYGKYLDSEKQPNDEFMGMVRDLEKRLEYAKKNTGLPEKPDYNKINDFVMSVNEKVVLGTV